jgi:hypothetical protein
MPFERLGQNPDWKDEVEYQKQFVLNYFPDARVISSGAGMFDVVLPTGEVIGYSNDSDGAWMSAYIQLHEVILPQREADLS